MTSPEALPARAGRLGDVLEFMASSDFQEMRRRKMLVVFMAKNLGTQGLHLAFCWVIDG